MKIDFCLDLGKNTRLLKKCTIFYSKTVQLWISVDSHHFSSLSLSIVARATLFSSCIPVWEEKNLPCGPPGHPCQSYLSAAVFLCFLLLSSQHAAWLHKPLSAGECPTAGRLRLQQLCCVSPTRVPLPSVPDSVHQLAAHLCLSAVSPQHVDAGGLFARSEHVCFKLLVISVSQPVSRRAWLSVLVSEWHKGRLY